MNTKATLMTLTLCLTAAAVGLAASSSAQMGTWKMNEAKSKLAPGMGKNSKVVYEAAGANVKVTVDGVDKDGKATHNTWTGKFDGKYYPVKGDATSDARAYKTVDDHTMNISTMKNKKVVSTGKIVVSADGKSRVITISGTDASGKKFKSKGAYDKQ